MVGCLTEPKIIHFMCSGEATTHENHLKRNMSFCEIGTFEFCYFPIFFILSEAVFFLRLEAFSPQKLLITLITHDSSQPKIYWEDFIVVSLKWVVSHS